jgi:hypothetical protein
MASADDVQKKKTAEAEADASPSTPESVIPKDSEDAKEGDASTEAPKADADASAKSESPPAPPVTAKPWEGINVESTHEPIEIAGEPYIWLRPGTPVKATITQIGNLGLEALLVRIHKPTEGENDPEELPPSKVTITLGDKTEDFPILAPVEVELETEEHPLLLVSYPIVLERALEQETIELGLSVEKEDSPNGLAILLQQKAPPEDLPTLDLGGEAEETADVEPEAQPSTAGEPAADAAAEEGDATEDEQPTAGLIPETPPDEDTFTSILTSRNLDTGIPLRFHLQLELPGNVQPYGGLFPLSSTGGFRLLGGYGEGLMSHFLVGFGMDVDYQVATVDAVSTPITWTTADTRLRLEGSAKIFVLDFGYTALEMGILAGAGMILGTHAVNYNSQTSTFFLWGPTMRIGMEFGVAVGPGAVTLSLPVDQSFGISQTVKNYQPLAASMWVGYRLEL